ncbi:MAG: hypothetical protein V4580_12055 [Bacteroidota bacterium]
MKTILHLLFTVLGIQVLVAQTNTNNNSISPSTQNPTPAVNTPVIVTTKFNAAHPNTNALWRTDDENFSAEFRDPQSNMQRIIIYDAYGNVVRTQAEVDKANYPDNINLYYTETYPTENYQVWSCEDAHGNLTYYSVRKTGTLLFDKTGNYLSTKPAAVAKKMNYRHQ